MYFAKFEDSDRIEKREITPVRFVPLVRPMLRPMFLPARTPATFPVSSR